MTSAQQRRETVRQLSAGGLSLRRSCALCQISRSSLRYQPRPTRRANNQQLVARLHTIASEHPRYGYRRAHALVCRETPGVHIKRVHRLWRHARLCVPARRSRRRRTDRQVRRPIQASCPNQVWTYDCVHDTCANGQRLRILTLTDEFTRESLAIEVATTIPAARVVAILHRVFQHQGAPAYLRSDNGPEFVAQAVQRWLTAQQVQTAYIEPGSPWQNAYGERFNGRLRDECLTLEWFRNVAEAKVVIEMWRQHYNMACPHSSLDYQTPQEFRWAYDQQTAAKAVCGEPSDRSITSAILTV